MRIRRILTGVALAAGLSIVPAAAGATPATADTFDCTFYLMFQGYSGKIMEMGCGAGEDGSPVICEGSMRIAGVPEAIGQEACRRAALP